MEGTGTFSASVPSEGAAGSSSISCGIVGGCIMLRKSSWIDILDSSLTLSFISARTSSSAVFTSTLSSISTSSSNSSSACSACAGVLPAASLSSDSFSGGATAVLSDAVSFNLCSSGVGISICIVVTSITFSSSTEAGVVSLVVWFAVSICTLIASSTRFPFSSGM